jgi:hypothetical protein
MRRLLSTRGAALTATLVGVFWLAPFQAMAQAAAPAQAGEIIFVTGSVTLDGRAVAKGATVTEGQQLQTGAGGYVYLKTVDKGFLILRENSLAKVVSYHIDEQNPANTLIKYDLVQGVARHISGEAVRKSPKGFRFNTPVAAIGVRGTDFTVIADAQFMRVSVVSGGIVVSGFGAGCNPGGTGPCETASSRDLFAGDTSALLQVRRGEVTPELLRSPNLRPDSTVPPRADEPSKISRANTPPGDPSAAIEERKTALLNEVVQATPPPAPSPPPVVAPPAPPPPPVVVPPAPPPPPVVVLPPQLVWGRWQPLADLSASDAKLALANNGSYLPASVVGPYFITRNKAAEFSLPKDGAFGFQMTGGEAFLVGPGGHATAATIQNPQLQIDFGTRQFNTSLQVVGSGQNVDIRAQGDLTLQGEMISDIIRSNATVRGYTSGSNASEAAYIFSRQVDSLTRAVGGTSWAR